MKISVLIPSRGRPETLVKSVMALQRLASGNHEIIYAIGADHDDPATVSACIPLGPSVRVHVLRRRGSLGQIVNILAEQCPADVYCSYADDIEMLEPGWDQHIADAVEQHPDWVMWLKANVADRFNTYAIVPEKWRKAAGRIFTDYFPFWHDDGWLMQVDLYARGAEEWVALEVDVKEMGEMAGKTHRLFAEDFPFWQQFFWSRDRERLEEAARIAKALGWPVVDHPERFRLIAVEEFTQVQLTQRSEGGVRTPEYMQAFERAKTIFAAGA
jgi:glycosyltransferase involved in cell wall biosynthesis